MRNVIFLLIASLFSACANQQGDHPSCKSQESCLTDPNCECWCSVKCGYRKKTSADHPIYIKDDPNGKHCYCKQWDADYYQENCVEGKNIPQHPNSQ